MSGNRDLFDFGNTVVSRLPMLMATAKPGPILVVVLVLALLGQGCVAHRMYRPESVVVAPAYDLAFIELDDHGELWSPAQVARALARIRHASASDEGAILLVFIHGWGHNAAEGDANVEGFRSWLASVSEIEAMRAPANPRRVVGVYVGWRGKSSRLKALGVLTFFERFAAAKRVASPATTQVLYEMMLTARANPRNTTVVAGHSFGGLILESAMAQALIGSLGAAFGSDRSGGGFPGGSDPPHQSCLPGHRREAAGGDLRAAPPEVHPRGPRGAALRGAARGVADVQRGRRDPAVLPVGNASARLRQALSRLRSGALRPRRAGDLLSPHRGPSAGPAQPPALGGDPRRRRGAGPGAGGAAGVRPRNATGGVHRHRRTAPLPHQGESAVLERHAVLDHERPARGASRSCAYLQPRGVGARVDAAADDRSARGPPRPPGARRPRQADPTGRRCRRPRALPRSLATDLRHRSHHVGSSLRLLPAAIAQRGPGGDRDRRCGARDLGRRQLEGEHCAGGQPSHGDRAHPSRGRRFLGREGPGAAPRHPLRGGCFRSGAPARVSGRPRRAEPRDRRPRARERRARAAGRAGSSGGADHAPRVRRHAAPVRVRRAQHGPRDRDRCGAAARPGGRLRPRPALCPCLRPRAPPPLRRHLGRRRALEAGVRERVQRSGAVRIRRAAAPAAHAGGGSARCGLGR